MSGERLDQIKAKPKGSGFTCVHSRLYFCRDAALMRLTNGLDRLVSGVSHRLEGDL